MALWEYKVITSGKGGFATPALLEKFLNDLGREEWEIIDFRSSPDNALAFTGLARRSTQRDWTLEDAAAAAAKAEAEKLRAEFSAKFQAATGNGPMAEEKAPSFLEEKAAPDDGFRKPVDTSRDDDPDAPEEDASEKDEWDKLAEEDELPSFFDALKPHMRRNQRGPGMSVGTDYLAKKWGLDESDIKGALVECGLQIPADENAKPVYVEYDGDLYWVNINRRGEVWINTREKPRPVFRVVQANRLTPEAATELTEAPKGEEKTARREEKGGEDKPQKTEPVRHRGHGAVRPPEEPAAAVGAVSDPATPGAPLPAGTELLEKIRPMMRRNRRGPGGSGSTSYLARALKCSESELISRFTALGLVAPVGASDPAVNVELGNEVWWLNKDSRGGVWINGREKRKDEPATSGQPAARAEGVDAVPTPEMAATADAPIVSASSAAEAAGAQATAELPLEVMPSQRGGSDETKAESPTPDASPGTAPAPRADNVLPAVRLLLKETRTGGFAGKVDRVATELNKSVEDLTSALVSAGLKVPEKAREKPVFVEHAGEIYWFNKNAKGELWVNAKASKYGEKTDGEPAGDESGKRPRRSRPRKSAEPVAE